MQCYQFFLFEYVNSICWLNGGVCATSPAKPQMTCRGRWVDDWLWVAETY